MQLGMTGSPWLLPNDINFVFLLTRRGGKGVINYIPPSLHDEIRWGNDVI